MLLGADGSAVRIVLDTYVVISALLWRGTPYQFLQALWRNEKIRLISSEALLAELSDVLARAWASNRLASIGLSARNVFDNYVASVEIVTPTVIPRVVAADPDDDEVVAAAIAADAELIVSGDRALLDLGSYGNIRVVTVATALRHIAWS